MTYAQALDYIHNTLKFGSKPGLTRIGRLLDKLGNPQDDLRFVHITGTNGKGSVSAATANILKKAGYRTGLYISPYVLDFCERIQIDGEMIPHDDLVEVIEHIQPFIEQVSAEYEHPTEFEIITAAAFYYFKQKKCDIVVLEVGLGGRFDATNIVTTTLVSVITSVSYDHMEVLGDTLDKIAFEKCGIIKNNAVTVVGPGTPQEALDVIHGICSQRRNAIIIPDINAVEVVYEGIDGSQIIYDCDKIAIPLCGRHQIGNFLVAYEIAAVLKEKYGIKLTKETVLDGLASVEFPARIEILGRSPLIILDGGHNIAAVGALTDCIDRYLADKKITVVMGIFKDKDYKSVIPMIASRAEHFIAVRPDNPRALEPQKTAEIASIYCRRTDCIEDLHEAFEYALEHTRGDGVILICGSFYLSAPMRPIVLEHTKK